MLLARRRPQKRNLLFVIDEMGQFVARDRAKLEELRAAAHPAAPPVPARSRAMDPVAPVAAGRGAGQAGWRRRPPPAHSGHRRASWQDLRAQHPAHRAAPFPPAPGG
jgi:hypothetical protein